MDTVSGQFATVDRLEHEVTLSEILDQNSLQRVCMTFTKLFGGGLAVLDTRGQMLVDIPAELPLCRHIGIHPRGTDVCGAFDMMALSSDADDGDAVVAKHCACGMRYEMLAIKHQGVVLGRLIYGPYRPQGLAELPEGLAEALGDGGERGVKAVEAARLDLEKMPAQPPQQAIDLVRAIGDVIDVIVQTGYARHLTSQIHIAAIQDAYNELQEKNRRLADSLDKLQELDKLKSNFLATVSHELRTPLTSVIGYSEMLLEGLAGELNKEQRDYIRTIMDKGDQLLQIISEILDISKIESGAVQLSCERVNLSELLEHVSDAMMPQARRKKIKLSHESPEKLPQIFADRAKTRQVLLNLFSNAIKFTPDGGVVDAVVTECQLRPEGAAVAFPAVEIRVRDTGVGIPSDSHQRIFEPFYQVDNSSTRVHGGSGLGLSIVKHFVEAHGGKVWVENREELELTGSIFVVQLPLSPPKSASSQRIGQRSRLVG